MSDDLESEMKLQLILGMVVVVFLSRLGSSLGKPIHSGSTQTETQLPDHHNAILSEHAIALDFEVSLKLIKPTNNCLKKKKRKKKSYVAAGNQVIRIYMYWFLYIYTLSMEEPMEN